jgi:hypothetical protein
MEGTHADTSDCCNAGAGLLHGAASSGATAAAPADRQHSAGGLRVRVEGRL